MVKKKKTTKKMRHREVYMIEKLICAGWAQFCLEAAPRFEPKALLS